MKVTKARKIPATAKPRLPVNAIITAHRAIRMLAMYGMMLCLKPMLLSPDRSRIRPFLGTPEEIQPGQYREQ
jgi:hypothetical protein